MDVLHLSLRSLLAKLCFQIIPFSFIYFETDLYSLFLNLRLDLIMLRLEITISMKIHRWTRLTRLEMNVVLCIPTIAIKEQITVLKDLSLMYTQSDK